MITPTEATSTTCVIRARAFSDSLKDADRDRWTVGKMRHVLAALGETPVIINTDWQTGHTLVNVTLTGLRTGWCVGYEVGIRSIYSDGSGGVVWHDLANLGDTIIPLPGLDTRHGDAKWKAVRSFMDECSHAVELAQTQHGETRKWGSWSAQPGHSRVSVTYLPYPDSYADVAPRGKRGTWSYELEECRAQGLVRQQYMHDLYPEQYPAPVRRSASCANPWHRGLFDFMRCGECPTA